MSNRIRKLILGCGLFCFAAIGTTPMSAQNWPTDLVVEVSGGSAGPSGIDTHIRVDSLGHGVAFQSSKRKVHPSRVAENVAFMVDADCMAELWKTIQSSDFFDLEAEYSNAEISDGGFLKVRVQADGREHVVSAVNRYVQVLELLRENVNRLSPDALEVPGLSDFRDR